jgi:hypothetical protein
VKKTIFNIVAAGEEASVNTDWYESRMDGGIYGRWEDVPHEFARKVVTRDDGIRTYDYAGMLQKGKAWVVEPLRALQPHSFQAFQDVVGDLLLGIVLIKDLMNPEGPPLVTPVLFFDASGRMVEVLPDFAGNNYEDGNDTFGAQLSLPEALAKSWLWRTQGWRVPSDPFQGPLINRGLVCHPMQGWESIEGVLKSFDRKRWKWMMKGILERFPDAIVTQYNPHDGSPSEWISMRCFLDTRPPGVNGPVGDQLFVFDEKRDQTVYHIHNGNLDDIHVLREPADAIDRYCAHVLRRHQYEFDFSPWSEPLKG